MVSIISHAKQEALSHVERNVWWSMEGRELFGSISEYYSTPDPFARARYLEKLKLLGLNESGDSNLGENMT